MPITILHGDCRDTLKTIAAGTVQCCVTSPPYWGLRSYLRKDHPDKAREIGQEKTPEAYVETMVQVFREVRRCLHESGVVFLNVGDSYAGSGRGTPGHNAIGNQIERQGFNGDDDPHGARKNKTDAPPGHKAKDLCLIPWMLAIALKADGWYLRSVICWHKKSCMPESVTDRPTNSWEPIFLLAKSQRYFYDSEAVKEPYTESVGKDRVGAPWIEDAPEGTRNDGGRMRSDFYKNGGRNQRNVWTLGPEPYSEAHFATFPTEIPRRAILAGTSAKGRCPKCYAPWERIVEKKNNGFTDRTFRSPHDVQTEGMTNGTGKTTLAQEIQTTTIGWQPTCKCGVDAVVPCTVLDPFGGSGTTGSVATDLGRNAILCELNDAYLPLIQKRTNVTQGMAL